MVWVGCLAVVAEVASSIHINSTVLCLFLFSHVHLVLVHPSIHDYDIFHITYFQEMQHA
jgi:hypothetical protein